MNVGVRWEPNASGRSRWYHAGRLGLVVRSVDAGGFGYGMGVEWGGLGIGMGHEGGRRNAGGVAVAWRVGGGRLEGGVSVRAVRGKPWTPINGSLCRHRPLLRDLAIASTRHRREQSVVVLAKLRSHHRSCSCGRRVAERDGASLWGRVQPRSLHSRGGHAWVVL